MSEGEPATTRARPLQVRCLHNPLHGEIDAHLTGGNFVWIDLEGPGEADLQKVSDHVKLHPLTLEDARTFRQRPKIEGYDGYVFMVVFGADPGAAPGGPLLREVHAIITGDAVITIRCRPLAALDDLRRRYDGQAVRSEQFLVYTILDAVTATFVPVLSRVDDEIDDLEQRIIDAASAEELQRIFSLKRDLVAMRRVVSPMRDAFARNADQIAELPGLQADDRLYFRDLYDGLVRVAELVDSYRDLLSGATDMYLSTVANRQGDINRQLTIIATIFLPLTFVTGFFGQNFAYLTGKVQSTTWSFFGLGIGLLVVSVVVLWAFLRRKRWM